MAAYKTVGIAYVGSNPQHLPQNEIALEQGAMKAGPPAEGLCEMRTRRRGRQFPTRRGFTLSHQCSGLIRGGTHSAACGEDLSLVSGSVRVLEVEPECVNDAS